MKEENMWKELLNRAGLAVNLFWRQFYIRFL